MGIATWWEPCRNKGEFFHYRTITLTVVCTFTLEVMALELTVVC